MLADEHDAYRIGEEGVCSDEAALRGEIAIGSSIKDQHAWHVPVDDLLGCDVAVVGEVEDSNGVRCTLHNEEFAVFFVKDDAIAGNDSSSTPLDDARGFRVGLIGAIENTDQSALTADKDFIGRCQVLARGWNDEAS
ncbi:MAG: hypothetical protein ACI8W3_000407 [Myxococcota bacterium]|jgi:hypothetical protein